MIRSKNLTALLLILVSATLLPSCASLDVEPPELTLVNLQPTEATPFESTLLVDPEW